MSRKRKNEKRPRPTPPPDGPPRGKWRPAAALLGTFSLFLLTLGTFPFGEQWRFLDLSIASFTSRGEERMAYRETPIDSIQILRKDLLGEPHYYRMVTNNYSMSATDLRAKRYMKLFVYLPTAIRPGLQRAMLVGYGCGNTARALLDDDSVQSVDVVDISSGLLEVSREIYPRREKDPLADPRVTIHVEDARFFLLSTSGTYDLITGEPPPPKASKVVNLYTREFFSLARDRLSPRGVVTYWLPVDQLFQEETRAVVRAFCDVFDDCSLWSGSETQWIMMGTRGSARPVSEGEFEEQWADPVTGPEMRALGFPGPEQFGSLYIADGRRLREWLGESPALTDNYPWRLTPWGPPTREDFDVYRELADPQLSRDGFLEGAGVSGRWPPDLRMRSGQHFQVRDMVNRLLEQPDPLHLEACLLNPLLGDYILWAFRSDITAQRILSRAGSRKTMPDPLNPEVLLHLAAGEARNRNYAGAANNLRRAVDDGFQSPTLRGYSPADLQGMIAVLLEASR